ncbi:hypothetical protein [Ruegeria sp. ANG-S4]|uniref:hypothetical protein n=1 Tax=Ruegeria sp. ANG-S4 TaxID=1577904 RepID=UPI000AE7C8E5|nr:hypothetical protein [Ruegeria sp. ANG-S4]
MRTGENGRIAVYWTQTELDGLESASLADLSVGSSWSWRGPSVDIATEGRAGLNTQIVKDQMRAVPLGMAARLADGDAEVFATLELSNGAQRFVADLVRVDGDARAVMVFEHGCPQRELEFWVSSVSFAARAAGNLKTDETVVAFPSVATATGTAAVRRARIAGVAAE